MLLAPVVAVVDAVVDVLSPAEFVEDVTVVPLAAGEEKMQAPVSPEAVRASAMVIAEDASSLITKW